MTSCDLWDNHSLVTLYTHKLEGFQGMYDFPIYVDNKGLFQLFPEQKCLPEKMPKKCNSCKMSKTFDIK